MFWTALKLALLAAVIEWDRAVPHLQLDRPLVLSPIVGLILGNLEAGIAIGITLELMWIGVVWIGAAIPTDYFLGGMLATSFAILTGGGTETALAIAVPAAVFGQVLNIFMSTINVWLVHWTESRLDKGDVGFVGWAQNLIALTIRCLRPALVVFLMIYFGSGAVSALVQRIPPLVTVGLQAAGNMLPALGFAVLLSIMAAPGLLPYYFVGFVLSTYLKMPIMGVTILGLVGAFLQDRFLHHDAEPINLSRADGVPERAPGSLTRADLRTLFLRSFYLPAAFNYERYQGLGYAYMMLPVLRKLYKDQPEKLRAAVKRNLEPFVTHPFVASGIIGIGTAMEEAAARDGSVAPESISSFKVSTMGPVAGLGDSLIWMTYRPICFSIGASLASKSGLLGPIVALILFNVPHIWLQWYPLVKGYEMGVALLESLRGKLQRISEALGVIGMMTLGTMTAASVKLTTKYAIPLGKAPINIQAILDAILPNLLPLALTYGMYLLIKKGKRPIWLMAGTLALGVLGAWVRFFQ